MHSLLLFVGGGGGGGGGNPKTACTQFMILGLAHSEGQRLLRCHGPQNRACAVQAIKYLHYQGSWHYQGSCRIFCWEGQMPCPSWGECAATWMAFERVDFGRTHSHSSEPK